MTYDEAFGEFIKEKKDKFNLKDSKHGDKSITRDSVHILDLDIKELWNHFWSEIQEFAAFGNKDPSEGPDVSNMAFLIWWHDLETKKLVKLS